MRILMTADTVGGVWTYALDLAGALAAAGVEVHLATMGRRLDAGQRARLARSAVAALHESTFALEWQEDPWADLARAGDWLLALEDASSPDVVHLNGYAHGVLPWRAPVVVVAHSDVLSWWTAVKGVPAPSEWERYRIAVEAGLRAADVVCAPTQAVLDDLARHYRLRASGLVVHNGRAAPRPADQPKEPFVLGIGRFDDEAKNAAALRRMRAASSWPVVLLGEGTLLGRRSQDEVASYLGRAAVFASPARYEPFGLAALEAGLAGCALVLGDLPSLREVWGEAALYVAPDDDAALAAALRLLQSDAALTAELGGRARARAARYTPAAMARGYAAVYERALAREPVEVEAA